MRVAFATLNGNTVTSHFGRTKGFVVVDVIGGVEKSREFRETVADDTGDPEHRHRHHRLVGTVADCDVVVAGGMGHPIHAALEHAGVDVILTAVRPIDDALARYLDGTIDHDPGRVHAHGGHHH